MMRLLSLMCLASCATAFMPAMTSQVARVVSPAQDASILEDAAAHCSSTQLHAFLQDVDLSTEKYYPPKAKETPKVLGGVKIGLRKLVVVTGASSGLGLQCAKTLAKTGRYFVVMACRDVEKGKRGRLTTRFIFSRKRVTFDDVSHSAFSLSQLPSKMDSPRTLTLS